jgi:O-antigen/teichoic acid export membrane protein
MLFQTLRYPRVWVSTHVPLLRRGTAVFEVFTLMTGGVLAQAVNLAGAPVLTRLYSLENFGIFAIYASILLVCGPLVSARYELAIVPAGDDDEAFGLLVLSCVLSFVVAVLAVLLCHIPRLIALLRFQALVPYLWIIPLGIVGTGFYQALYQFCVRQRQYNRVSASQVIQTGVSVSGQAALGTMSGLGALGLLGGQLVGIAISALGLGWNLRRAWSAWRSAHEGQLFKTVVGIAVRHRNHPIYLPWGGFVNSLAQRLPALVLLGLYGANYLGLYAVADRLLRTPIGLVGQASSPVLFRKMTEQHIKARMTQLLFKWAIVMTLLAIVPFLLLVRFGDPFFSFALGKKWAPAATVGAALIPTYWGALVVSPISTLLIVANRQALLLSIQLLFLFSGLFAFWVGHHFGYSPNSTMLIYSLSQWAVYMLYFAVLLIVAKEISQKPELVSSCVA